MLLNQKFQKRIYGYIKILAFDEETKDKFEEKYNELKSKGIKSLIIDVRNNGGGLVDVVIDLAKLIVPKDKTIMKTLDKNGNEEITISDAKDTITMKIVVLANENSASAAEILVGALQDNKLATIVGTTTFGKGIMQEIFPIEGFGAMKITIQEFRTPNRKCNK